MLVYEKTIKITEDFLDKNHHVNNVQYVQWVEMIAIEHWDFLKQHSSYGNKIWFLVDHHIQYKKEAFLGDTLLVRTYPEPPEGIRQPRKVEFYRQGELIVDSRTLWVMMDSSTNKVIRLNPNWFEELKS